MVERVELQIDGMYQVQDSLHHRKYILYLHVKYIKNSQRLTVRQTTDVPGDTADCWAVFSATLYLAERTPLIPAPGPLPYTVCWGSHVVSA